MLLAYVDASGNTGPYHPGKSGGSQMFVVGCVLIQSSDWPQAFDQMVNLRRRLSDRFRLRPAVEIRAQFITRGRGPGWPPDLAPGERRMIFSSHLDILARLPARAFAVAVDKRADASGPPVFNSAWEGLLQRLERTTSDEQTTVMVIHDAGEYAQVRRWVRRARRHLTAGSAFYPGTAGNKPARFLIEDPIPRDSKHSYFIQVADLVAYAAFRSVVPPGPDVGKVCPKDTWQAIGEATHCKVNSLKERAAPGIVLR